MMNKPTTKSDIVRKIQQCGNTCSKHRNQLNELNDMIQEVYGVSYNDVDCDPIIDVVEIIGGDWTGGAQALDDAIYNYSDVPRENEDE